MRRGDIEIRIKGARFSDVDADKLLQMVRDVAKLWPGTELIATHPTYFVLRPRKKPEVTCPPTPSPPSNTETSAASPDMPIASAITTTRSNTPVVPAKACE
jgi:hypothetical protein